MVTSIFSFFHDVVQSYLSKGRYGSALYGVRLRANVNKQYLPIKRLVQDSKCEKGLNASAKSIDTGQPAHFAQTNLYRNFLLL